MRFWEPDTGRVGVTIGRPGVGPEGPLFGIGEPTHDWAFTPDGAGFVWRAGPMQRWDTRTGRPVWADTFDAGHAEAVERVAFSPDGRWLASLADDQDGVGVWDAATGRPARRIAPVGGRYLTFLPDGRTLLTGSPFLGTAMLRGWDVGTGAEVRKYDLANPRNVGSAIAAVVTATADGRTVAALSGANGGRSDHGLATVWDAQTGRVARHGPVPWAPTPRSPRTPPAC